jgi:hypothetical protein
MGRIGDTLAARGLYPSPLVEKPTESLIDMAGEPHSAEKHAKIAGALFEQFEPQDPLRASEAAGRAALWNQASINPTSDNLEEIGNLETSADNWLRRGKRSLTAAGHTETKGLEWGTLSMYLGRVYSLRAMDDRSDWQASRSSREGFLKACLILKQSHEGKDVCDPRLADALHFASLREWLVSRQPDNARRLAGQAVSLGMFATSLPIDGSPASLFAASRGQQDHLDRYCEGARLVEQPLAKPSSRKGERQEDQVRQLLLENLVR